MNLEKYPNLHAILAGTIAGDFRNWPLVRPELMELMADVKYLELSVERVAELETVLSKVQQWGADSRSVNSYEVFRDVAEVLNIGKESIRVVDCTCIFCVCPPNEENCCLGCGARTCLAHELAKGGSR